MQKKILLIIVYATFGLWARGQSLSSAVIAAAGAESFTATMSLEWTLGDFMVSSLETEKGLLTEGFHQPLLQVTEVPKDLFSTQSSFAALNENSVHDNPANAGIQIDVWPNPVHSILTIKVETETDDEIFIELFDVMGRKMISKTNHIPTGLIELDFTPHPSGLYLLKFLKKDGTLIKTILNTKH